VKAYRDLWLGFGTALLAASAGLLAIALAYFIKVQKYSLFTSWWMGATVIVFALAFICIFSAIKGCAFPWWEKPDFPEVKVDLYGASYTTIPRTASGSSVEPLFIWVYRVRVVNLEKEQNASLIIRPFFGLAPDGPGPFAETTAMHANPEQLERFFALSPGISFAPNPLPEAIFLSPATPESGDLVYMVSTFSWQKLAQPWQVRLVIEDLISGKAMEKTIDAYGAQFTSKDMSAAKPGPRMFEQDQRDEAPGSPEADETPANIADDSAVSG
jgi:hypothetical protein